MGGIGSGAKPRVYPPEIIKSVQRMYLDEGMTVAEVQAALPSGYKAQRIIERHIPNRRRAVKRDQSGERNHMWRDDPGYQAAHLRVAAQRGKASEHACVDCRHRAAEWSYDHADDAEFIDQNGRRYSADPSHYNPRCVSCHRRHDATRRMTQGGDV